MLEQVCTWSASETLTLPNWRPWGYRRIRRRWWRATARCKQEKKLRFVSKNWIYSWHWCFLKKHPQFLHSGSSARIISIPSTGPVVKNHISHQNGMKINCTFANNVPFVVRGLSTSSSTSSTPASSTSSSQDSVFDGNRYTENPVQERSGSTSEELRGNPMQKPTATENKNKNEGREEVQSDLLRDLPDWLQDFIENLVDESSPSEPWWKRAPNDQDTSRSSHDYQWCREQKWNRFRVSVVCTRTFQRTQCAFSAWRQK